MLSIESCPLPTEALLNRYLQDGAYTDCYRTEIPGMVTHAQYVNAFYKTSVFRLERLILKWAVAKPSTDAQVDLLADDKTEIFSAWHVEKRSKNQLLLCDYQGRTRSWLMLEPAGTQSGEQARLYFGSAVVPVKSAKTGKASFGFGFYTLLWFHKTYSVILLLSAKLRLQRKST